MNPGAHENLGNKFIVNFMPKIQSHLKILYHELIWIGLLPYEFLAPIAYWSCQTFLFQQFSKTGWSQMLPMS